MAEEIDKANTWKNLPKQLTIIGAVVAAGVENESNLCPVGVLVVAVVQIKTTEDQEVRIVQRAEI